MNWDDLRYILAVHRAGNLTNAATTLGVSRTTVGRRLRALEEHLDARLLEVMQEGVQLTSSGLELVEIAQKMESHLHDAQGRILGQNLELQGSLRVTLLDFIYEGLVDVFASFIETYPNVELTVVITDEMVSLRRREADVAIRLSNDPAASLVGRKLGKLNFAVYGARALVERVGEAQPLNAYPWIHQDERTDTRWFDQWLKVHAPGAKVVLRQDHYSVRRASVQAGLGLCLLPCFDGDRDPNLVCLGHHLFDEARHLWILTLDELRANLRIRTFMAHVHQAFLDQPDLLGR